MKKKLFGSLGISSLALFVTSQTTFAADDSIYTGKTGIDSIDNASNTVLSAVAGIGMTAFTLAFLVIALVLGFGSLSPQNTSRAWKAFFICLVAALIFFAAYMLPEQVQGLVTKK